MRLDPNHPAVHRASFVELLEKLRPNRNSRFNAFAHLLQIAFAGATALEARFNVGEDSAVRCDVFIRKRYQVHIAHNVDVGLRGIQRDQFGALTHAIGGSIDAGCLAPNFVD